MPDSKSFLLDFIRSTAALVVLVTHVLYFSHLTGIQQTPHWDAYVRHGHAAVAVFFVLSGYVIAFSVERSLEKKPGYGFRTYFLDRWSRIYSVLVPALAITALLDAVGQTISARYYLDPALVPQRHYFLRLATGLLCLQGVHGYRGNFGTNTALWSIGYEWAFYLWYGVVRLVALRTRRPVLWTLVTCCIFAALYGITITSYLALWLLGVGAYLFQRRCAASIPFAIACSIVIGAHYAINMQGTTGLARDAVFSAVIANILAFRHVSGVTPGSILDRISKTFAEFSYSLYAYHMPILMVLLTVVATRFQSQPFPVVAACLTIITILATRLLYSITEAKRGILRQWADRFLCMISLGDRASVVA